MHIHFARWVGSLKPCMPLPCIAPSLLDTGRQLSAQPGANLLHSCSDDTSQQKTAGPFCFSQCQLGKSNHATHKRSPSLSSLPHGPLTLRACRGHHTFHCPLCKLCADTDCLTQHVFADSWSTSSITGCARDARVNPHLPSHHLAVHTRRQPSNMPDFPSNI